ncbi:MAG: hypothetical protein RLY43_263 [Bacteroidota bacterium]
MTYDIGIIGAGVSGVFAAFRLAEKYKNLKIAVFEFGPPPPTCLRQDPLNVKRRRRQLEGFFGCFPTGDGKIYIEEDSNKLSEIIDGRKVRSAKEWVQSKFSEIQKSEVVKSKSPSTSVKKSAKENGYEFIQHSYEQWYPEQIHQLSKLAIDTIESTGNITLNFDTEVFNISKNGKKFVVNTSDGDVICKKLILGVGRSGWRWSHNLYKSLGILQPSNDVKYGIRVEMPTSQMKEFNKSHCSFVRDDIEIGPLNWFGSIVQEDHEDMTVAAFRANENRWKTDKVFFSLYRNFEVKTDTCEYIDRIAKLSHLLSGDRVGREKIRTFIKGDGDLVAMPEYKWIKSTVQEVEKVIPNILSRGYFHVPDIFTTNVNKINIANNLETEIDGLFVAGESAGVRGIAAAAISGVIAADNAAK